MLIQDGSQPKMHDMTRKSRVQRMVDSKGTPKGMRQVLLERGVDVRRMKADDMRKKLKKTHDFKYKKLKSKPQFLLAATGACSSPNITANLTQLNEYGAMPSNTQGDTVITLLLD